MQGHQLIMKSEKGRFWDMLMVLFKVETQGVFSKNGGPEDKMVSVLDKNCYFLC